MYHQQDITAPVSLGGQLHGGGIDQTRKSFHEISKEGNKPTHNYTSLISKLN